MKLPTAEDLARNYLGNMLGVDEAGFDLHEFVDENEELNREVVLELAEVFRADRLAVAERVLEWAARVMPELFDNGPLGRAAAGVVRDLKSNPDLRRVAEGEE